MSDSHFKWFFHNKTKVQARKVKRRMVVETDRGKIVLHPGDYEIIGPDGTHYGNDADQFEDNFTEARE